jgi:STE24 endopeptidase
LRWEGLLRRAGVGSAGDPRALALVLAIVAVIAAASGPVQVLVSRRIETRADVHALDLTRDPQTFVEMQRRLSVTNLSDLDPPPLVFLLFATHPTGPQRIGLARDWAGLQGVPAPPPLAR